MTKEQEKMLNESLGILKRALYMNNDGIRVPVTVLKTNAYDYYADVVYNYETGLTYTVNKCAKNGEQLERIKICSTLDGHISGNKLLDGLPKSLSDILLIFDEESNYSSYAFKRNEKNRKYPNNNDSFNNGCEMIKEAIRNNCSIDDVVIAKLNKGNYYYQIAVSYVAGHGLVYCIRKCEENNRGGNTILGSVIITSNNRGTITGDKKLNQLSGELCNIVTRFDSEVNYSKYLSEMNKRR